MEVRGPGQDGVEEGDQVAGVHGRRAGYLAKLPRGNFRISILY